MTTQVLAPPLPHITTGSRNITIGAGPSDNGTWHRAVMVALELNKAGLWNGTDHLTLNYPYQLHQRLFGIEHASPADLIPGQDYVIKQPAPPAVKLSL
ncbi:MAG: hypothetical protein JXA10_16875, partial [Anaerolineae bacterium]|nr:hypothetical protein [Anaerolineae bacterium]